MSKVLIVDDEIEIVEFLNNFLQRKGVKVFTAINADDALAIFHKEKPSLILLDVSMPGNDGFTVLKTVKELSPQTKVVMITAKDDRASTMKAKKLDADNYLIKPIELEKLDAIVFGYIPSEVDHP